METKETNECLVRALNNQTNAEKQFTNDLLAFRQTLIDVDYLTMFNEPELTEDQVLNVQGTTHVLAQKGEHPKELAFIFDEDGVFFWRELADSLSTIELFSGETVYFKDLKVDQLLELVQTRFSCIRFEVNPDHDVKNYGGYLNGIVYHFQQVEK